MQKYFLKSKTIIGLLVVAFVGIAPQLGIEFGSEDGELINKTVDSIIEMLGLLLALYGRFVATESLTVKPKSGPPTAIPQVVGAFILVTLLAGSLTGCETWFSKNKATEVTVDSILAISTQVDEAERAGLISNELEDELQNKLIDALKLIKSGYVLTGTEGCPTGIDSMECAQVILIAVEDKLREAEQ